MGKSPEDKKQSDLAFAKAYNLLLADTGLTSAEKLVMIIVCRYWPNPYWDSNEQIAKELGFTERYVEKIVKRLADKKRIKRGFAHTTKGNRPHTVRVIVPLCFPEKCTAKIKWISTEQQDGQQAEQTDGQNPNNRTQLPEQQDDLLERSKKEINKVNKKATPAPLPAGGQASALLTDRHVGAIVVVEQLKESFGGGTRRSKPLSETEFERRKQAGLKALLEDKKILNS